jgi:hypothetical protein
MGSSLARVSALLLALGTVSLEGCSDKFIPNDLVGSYTLNVGPGSDVLELKSDGTYVHSYQDANFPKSKLGGKWQLDSTPDGEVVTLEDFKVLPEKKRDRKRLLSTKTYALLWLDSVDAESRFK